MRRPASFAFMLSTAALAAALAAENKWPILAVIGANAVFGWLTVRRGWESVWLLIQFGVSALSGIPFLLALASSALGLAYWDLAAHDRLLMSVVQLSESEVISASHYRSLALALASGTVLAIVAIAVPLRLSFLAAILLALLTVVGISALAGRARSASS